MRREGARNMKEIDPLDRLRAFVAKHETQAAAAEALGVSGPYLSDILNRRRDFSDQILKRLGLRRIVVASLT
jgi:transcriptional regulator with XRE-family HTH domain